MARDIKINPYIGLAILDRMAEDPDRMNREQFLLKISSIIQREHFITSDERLIDKYLLGYCGERV